MLKIFLVEKERVQNKLFWRWDDGEEWKQVFNFQYIVAERK